MFSWVLRFFIRLGLHHVTKQKIDDRGRRTEGGDRTSLRLYLHARVIVFFCFVVRWYEVFVPLSTPLRGCSGQRGCGVLLSAGDQTISLADALYFHFYIFVLYRLQSPSLRNPPQAPSTVRGYLHVRPWLVSLYWGGGNARFVLLFVLVFVLFCLFESAGICRDTSGSSLPRPTLVSFYFSFFCLSIWSAGNQNQPGHRTSERGGGGRP